MPRRPKLKTLGVVRPNVGIEMAYRRRLLALVDEMAKSFEYWIKARYRENAEGIAEIAADASPSSQLRIELNKLARQWRRRFNDAAPELAEYFALSASRRSDAALRAILRKAGISVKFKLDADVQEIIRAIVAENVQLIRSIPEQYLTQVQGSVMRSVSVGRDLATLSRELRRHHGVTARRAALISLDQNNKATSAVQRTRQVKLGLKEGIWMHSHAGREPRPTHLANDGKRFVIAEGWFDPDPKVRKRIWPGELIRCRCTWRPIVPGLT